MRIQNYIFVTFFSCCFCFTTQVKAQQEAQFSQYMYNNLSINPAFAGNRGALSLFALHRSQWVGFDDAPQTNLFSAHTPFRNSKFGLGVSILSERFGPVNQNNISTDFSYWIQLNARFRLSFGLRLNANLFNLNNSRLNPQQANDPLLSNFESEFNPNIGAGVFLHSQKTFIGFSIPAILSRDNLDSDSFTAVSVYRPTAYLYGGYVFDIFPFIKFKPATFLKIQDGAPLQLDLSTNFLFHEKFTLGAAWRWNASISFLTGFQLSQRIFIGYAYDRETTDLQEYHSGSHEVFLRFELFNRKGNLVSPRFF